MKTRSPSAKRRRPDSERGATLVEFALIAVMLFSIIFGIIEGAFAVRARNTISNATDDAARRGAIAATNDNADWLILQQLFGRGAADAARIDYVTVYKADNGSEGPNPACIGDTPTPVNGVCNVYFPESFNASEAEFDCTSSALDANWCPGTMRGSGADIGFLGVYVKGTYEPLIGALVISFEFDMDARSLQAIETSGQL